MDSKPDFLPFLDRPDDEDLDLRPFFDPPDDEVEPKMDSKPDFLPFFELDVDVADAVCENGESGTLSST